MEHYSCFQSKQWIATVYLICVDYDRGLIFKDMEIPKRRDPQIIDIKFCEKHKREPME